MGEIIGYARTSGFDQKAGLDDQIGELQRAGATKIFKEQVSGVDAKRPQLQEALRYLRGGDTFVVTKPDRLARSTADLLKIANDLQDMKDGGVALRVLSMGAAGGQDGIDTSTATGKLILTVLAGIAEFERAIMLERQRAGIQAAKEAGKYKGRAPTAQAKAGDVLKLHGEGAGIMQIVERTGVSRASVYRLIKVAELTQAEAA